MVRAKGTLHTHFLPPGDARAREVLPLVGERRQRAKIPEETQRWKIHENTGGVVIPKSNILSDFAQISEYIVE